MKPPLSIATYIRAVLHDEDWTQDELAQGMRVSRLMVWRLANNRARITVNLAQRLASVTKVSAKTWLARQAAVDLAKGER